MAYRSRARTPRRRRANSCLVALVVLVWFVLLLLLAYRFLIRPGLTGMVADRVGTQVETQIAGQLAPALQAAEGGTYTITDTELNEYLQGNTTMIAPLESAEVRFVPGQVEADVRAYGTPSRISAGLVVQNGQVIVQNPQVDGLLGQAIDLRALLTQLETTINAELRSAGIRAESVEIRQGVLVVTIAR